MERLQPATRRILIVDTCEDTVRSLGLLLSSAGCNVRSLPTGVGALDLIEDYRPHVMFLESDLGVGPSGLDIARALCSRGRSNRPLIVMVSAWAQDADRAAAFAACSDHFYAKPAEPDLMLDLALYG